MNYKNLLMNISEDPFGIGLSVKYVHFEEDKSDKVMLTVEPKDIQENNHIIKQYFHYNPEEISINQAEEKVSEMMIRQLLRRGALSLYKTHSEPFVNKTSN